MASAMSPQVGTSMPIPVLTVITTAHAKRVPMIRSVQTLSTEILVHSLHLLQDDAAGVEHQPLLYLVLKRILKANPVTLLFVQTQAYG